MTTSPTIVDKSPPVSSAALVSSLHLFKTAPEVIKRWVNEAQEALNSDNVMVQYHGLGLLYQIRKTDRLGVTKLVAKLTKMPLKSPYAACHLVFFSSQLLKRVYQIPFHFILCQFNRFVWFAN